MAFYRIMALIKKDLAWIWSEKSLAALIFSGAFLGGLMLAVGIIVELAGLSAPSSPFVLSSLILPLFILNFATGISLTFLLFFKEKEKGTLQAMLTTPLAYLECLMGKLFLTFSVCLLFSIIFVLSFVFVLEREGFLNPLLFVNLILFSAFFCLIGGCLGVGVETLAEQKNVMGLVMLALIFPLIFINDQLFALYPSLKKLYFFSYFSHFKRIIVSFPEMSWQTALFHTGFNFLIFLAVLLFSVSYIRFYFANGREKRFSLKLFAGLGGILSVFVVSGFVSPPILKKLKRESAALLELRALSQKLSQKQGLPPVRHFFKNHQIARMRLSPDGKYLAYLKPYKNRMNIHVRKRGDDESAERRITSQSERDIAGFSWKESHTLIFRRDFGGDENFHIFRVSANGEGEKDLTPFKETQVSVIDSLDEISEEHILIAANQRDKRVFDAYRLNVKSGDIQMIAKNPGNFTGWMIDHEGKLRIALSQDGLSNSIFYRETEREEFQKITTIGFKDSLQPLFFTFDNKNLYVASNLNRDKTAIQLFDLKRKKALSVLFSHPEVDVNSLTYSKKRKTLISANYVTWKTERHFFDPLFEGIFQDAQAKIPGKEISLASTNRAEDLLVIYAYSDRQPGSYYLYDVKAKSLQFIANTRPWIKEGDMAETKPIKYVSRDGLAIHGYLTLPPGSSGKSLPVVVNPHGGPWIRDSWGYNPEVQFLASRGYAVLQMDYRGSKGYGKKFWMASFKQWGRRMQDDITDGVKYLIRRGIADKNRVAIYGGSYGGYAVLAGLAFTPDLYACGVDYVGISNLFTWAKSFPPYWKLLLEKAYEMVGHPEKDKELFREVSPFFHADKIKAPLFVAQGVNDPRVKKAESDQIVSALEERGVNVPYLVKDNEGHGFSNQENRMEFYSLMDAFLHSCLKKPDINE